jgi:uncharacterized repeat protein (TIGR03833 family)
VQVRSSHHETEQFIRKHFASGYFIGSAIKKYGRRERMNGTARENIKPGQTVLIVLKQDQRSGKLTRGVVKDILTKSPTHPRGIKVRLESGEIGRVKEIVA